MRWVLMLFVILAAVMGGEARAVVVMGRAAVSEWGGKAATVEETAEALRVESAGAPRGAVWERRDAVVVGHAVVCRDCEWGDAGVRGRGGSGSSQ